MILKMILLVLAANAGSCLIFRLWWGGRMEMELTHHTRYEEHYSIYIAGMANQPEVAFKLICNLRAPNTVLMRYLPFGWSAKRAAKQLAEFCDQQDSLLAYDLYAISVGDKVARYLPRDNRMDEYAINPCPSPEVLKPGLRRGLPLLVIIVELLTLALGWIAMIPCLPMEGGKCFYSLTLLADQVWQIAMVRTLRGANKPLATVISEEDEFLDNDAVKQYFKGVSRGIIEAKHARTGDPKCAAMYRVALHGHL